jgi:nitric oxide reductase NorE protein
MTELGDASAEDADQPADWGPLSGLPSNPMIWLLILEERVVFGVVFVGFSIAREFALVTFDGYLVVIFGLLLIIALSA